MPNAVGIQDLPNHLNYRVGRTIDGEGTVTFESVTVALSANELNPTIYENLACKATDGKRVDEELK